MEEKRRIEREIETLKSLQTLAQAHEEISTLKMKQTRGSVLATRDFLSSLLEMFVNVKSAYKKHLMEQMEKDKEKGTAFSTYKTNGKKVFMLLSANNKLFGDIVPRVFELFKESCLKEDADIIVVGKLGREMYESSGINKPYQYFDIPDSEIKLEHIKPLITYILPYDSTIVFYGKFINFARQDAVQSNITGEQSIETTPQGGAKEYNFLFEPSIEKILEYFETQIFFSFFKQTIHESELARYASRVTVMEKALETMESEIKSYTLADRRLKNLEINKKQLERIAGVRLWKKR